MPFTTLGYKAIKSFAFMMEKSYGECPICGGKLIKKSGRYGKFVGCSKYPKCKYTRDFEC